MKKVMFFILTVSMLFSVTACSKEANAETAAINETVQQQTAVKNEIMQQTTLKLAQKNAAQTENDDWEEVEEVSEEAEEAEEVEEVEKVSKGASAEDINKSLLEMLNDNTVYGNQGLQAPERDIDYKKYPKKYDLRDFGVVTPVKNQDPWGTCWAFGTIAACETSILSEKETTYEATLLDLSEHHLAWFSNMHLEDQSSQDGEGVWHDYKWTSLAGGHTYGATTLLASGTGVAMESDFPYRGKNGIRNGESYSADDDWTIDAKDRFKQKYELEESRILPPTALFDDDGNYLGLAEVAAYDIKDEILDGKGVAVSYCPDDNGYNENTFTQYCGVQGGSQHVCCIVGWDDTISHDDFRYVSEDGKEMKPEGDGAWIVKNSWGAETESFPNSGDFGITDDEGSHTGFFYLSYYDRSIDDMVSFDFLVDESEEDYYIVDQYDYMQSETVKSSYSDEKMIMANEFMAEEDEVLRCISLETGAPGVSVHYEVCRVADPEKGPESAELWTSGDVDYRYAGFHRIDLQKPLELQAGEYYLVTFYQKAETDGKEQYFVSFHRDTNDKERDYHMKGIVNPKESWLYVSSLDRWIDWYDLVQLSHAMDEDTEIDNFSIKGFADPVK